MEKNNQSSFSKALCVVDKVIEKFEDCITVTLMVVMAVMVVAGVAMRYILQVPNPYGEEISRYCMVIIAFIGISMGVKHRAHLGVTGVISKIPGIAGVVVRLLSEAITTFAFALFSYQGFKFAFKTLDKGQLSASMRIPMGAMYMVIGIGFAISVVRMLIRIYDDFVASEENKVYRDGDDAEELNFQ